MSAQKHRLYQDVSFLSELRPYRNFTNPESLDKVCKYAVDVFTTSGLSVKEQKWMVRGKEFTNVIAVYNEGKARTLVVGAHYDVYGEQPGADDNASAVAGLFEIARLLGQNQPELDYTIELVAYCLEEPPFFDTPHMGSYIHALSLHENKTDVLGMICFEMIGYFSDLPGSQTFPNQEMADKYPDKGNFIAVVGIDKYAEFTMNVEALMSENTTVDVYEVILPASASLAGMSDHRNYWQFDIPALMINDTSFLRNPHYHLPSDTIDTLDFDKMTEVVNGAYHAIGNMNRVF